MKIFFHEHFNIIEPNVTLIDLIIKVQDHGEFIKKVIPLILELWKPSALAIT